MSPLAVIRRDNVLALMAHHDLNMSELAEDSGVGRSTIQLSFNPDSSSSRKVAASEKTMEKIHRCFHLWAGALDVRGFDPAQVSKPLSNITLTIHLKQLSRDQHRGFLKVINHLEALLSE